MVGTSTLLATRMRIVRRASIGLVPSRSRGRIPAATLAAVAFGWVALGHQDKGDRGMR
jgi:hypothetical protein